MRNAHIQSERETGFQQVFATPARRTARCSTDTQNRGNSVVALSFECIEVDFVQLGNQTQFVFDSVFTADLNTQTAKTK